MSRHRLSVVLLAVVAACASNAVAETPEPIARPVEAAEVVAAGNQHKYPTDIASVPTTRPVFEGMSTTTVPDHMTLVLMARGDVEIYESPNSGEPVRVVPGETILGTTTVLPIAHGPADGWAEVLLPGRPNSATGWVEVDRMQMFVVEGQIVVDLSERTLTYYENGDMVLETPVAVGKAGTPTPTGSFFVTDNVTLADPDSPWGPHAFGLSARSETITEFNGGDGIIGIHGTNQPGSIGKSASLGCVRVRNPVISQLHELIPLGTPVEIVA